MLALALRFRVNLDGDKSKNVVDCISVGVRVGDARKIFNCCSFTSASVFCIFRSMNGVAFDTLRLATALRDRAKLTQEQAEGFASAMAESLQDGLATKTDLNATEDRLKLRIEATGERLDGRIEATEERLHRRIEATEERLKLHVDVVRADLQRQMEANKADVLKWMIGTIGFQTLVLLGAVVGLSKMAHP